MPRRTSTRSVCRTCSTGPKPRVCVWFPDTVTRMGPFDRCDPRTICMPRKFSWSWNESSAELSRCSRLTAGNQACISQVAVERALIDTSTGFGFKGIRQLPSDDPGESQSVGASIDDREQIGGIGNTVIAMRSETAHLESCSIHAWCQFSRQEGIMDDRLDTSGD